MTALYLDVHVPAAIADQLRRRGVDVLTAQEDGSTELDDPALLERATALGRVLVTQDIRFKALADKWQQTGKDFSGLIFAHQLHDSIGRYVLDLELVAKATDAADWIGKTDRLPLR
jgi:hypothetical protein